MNIKGVRAWFSTGGGALAGFNLTYDQREVIVAKIMRAYADGAHEERKRGRDLAGKHEEARNEAYEKDNPLTPAAPGGVLHVPANAARDKIRKSVHDYSDAYKAGPGWWHRETKD